MPNQTIFLRMPEMEKARFRAWINSLKEDEEREVKALMVGTIYGIEKMAKRFVKVVTGYLKTSIHSAIDPDRYGGMVYTNREYAPYVEFGTGSKVRVSDDTRDYALTFKGKGKRKVNLDARPYLFPAVRIGIKAMEDKLQAMGFKLKR